MELNKQGTSLPVNAVRRLNNTRETTLHILTTTGDTNNTSGHGVDILTGERAGKPGAFTWEMVRTVTSGRTLGGELCVNKCIVLSYKDIIMVVYILQVYGKANKKVGLSI